MLHYRAGSKFFPHFIKSLVVDKCNLTSVTLDVSVSVVNRRAICAGHCITEFHFKHGRVKYQYNISSSNIILIELIVSMNTINYIHY